MRHNGLLVALLLAALPLAAQQRAHHDSCPMMHGGMSGMMQGGRGQGMDPMQGSGPGDSLMAPVREALTFYPGRLLDQKETLELTAQQESRLTQLFNTAQREALGARVDARVESEALAKALDAKRTDLKEIERRFQALHAALGVEHLVRLRASVQAQAILTDEQREKAAGILAARGGMACNAGR